MMVYVKETKIVIKLVKLEIIQYLAELICFPPVCHSSTGLQELGVPVMFFSSICLLLDTVPELRMISEPLGRVIFKKDYVWGYC